MENVMSTNSMFTDLTLKTSRLSLEPQEKEEAIMSLVKKEKGKRYLTILKWFIYLNNEIIGFIHFTNVDNRYMISFKIDEVYQNNGYATEAVSTLLNKIFSFDNKVKIFSIVDYDNPAGARVLIKCGFKHSDDELVYEGNNYQVK